MASMARLLLVWVLLFAYAPPTAEGQTTDSGLGGIALTSTASVAKEMHAAIRRNLNEHYGNIAVYMRLKGRVPPSTARTQ
jgi:hypothetical protein